MRGNLTPARDPMILASDHKHKHESLALCLLVAFAPRHSLQYEMGGNVAQKENWLSKQSRLDNKQYWYQNTLENPRISLV